jgi:hypothetical protein
VVGGTQTVSSVRPVQVLRIGDVVAATLAAVSQAPGAFTTTTVTELLLFHSEAMGLAWVLGRL